MYEARYPTGCYSRAKDAYLDPITLGRHLGRQADGERLEKRLQQGIDVFRSQCRRTRPQEATHEG